MGVAALRRDGSPLGSFPQTRCCPVPGCAESEACGHGVLVGHSVCGFPSARPSSSCAWPAGGSEHVFPAKCENGDESFSRCAVGTHMTHLDRCQPFPVGGLDLRNQIPLGIGELEDAGGLALGEVATDSTCPSPTNHSGPAMRAGRAVNSPPQFGHSVPIAAEQSTQKVHS